MGSKTQKNSNDFSLLFLSKPPGPDRSTLLSAHETFGVFALSCALFAQDTPETLTICGAKLRQWLSSPKIMKRRLLWELMRMLRWAIICQKLLVVTRRNKRQLRERLRQFWQVNELIIPATYQKWNKADGHTNESPSGGRTRFEYITIPPQWQAYTSTLTTTMTLLFTTEIIHVRFE